MPAAHWPHPPPSGRRAALAPLAPLPCIVALLLLLAAALPALSAPAARGAQDDGVRVQLLAINDFHGALETVPRPGDGRPVGGKRANFLRRGRQSKQIVGRTADERPFVGPRGENQAFLFELGQNELVHGALDEPRMFDRRHRRFLDRLEGPMGL